MSDSLTIDDVTVGAVLPVVELVTSRSFVVTTAIATRDFEPVHHDPEVAQASGLPDVFLNILTTNGLCVKYVTDWAGPQAIAKGTAIRLGVPHVAGATLKFSGEVTAIEGTMVTVAVTGRNATGNHVTGRVRVELPEAVLPLRFSSTQAST
ncbi:MAG: hypothetical protein KY469_13695 [Actinobacteria bacterium]|nr:hypothetical protein [Actinomycetota bacterium]